MTPLYKLYTLDNKLIKEINYFPSNYTGIIKNYEGPREWLVGGKWHRLDGPAIIWEDGIREWWVYGEQITEKECKLLHSIMKLKELL